MSGVAYDDVVKVLVERFPEFAETDDCDPDDFDLPYLIWGLFGRFATNRMRRTPAEHLDEDPFVARVFDMANELMDSDDSITNDIVMVELFEQFVSYRKTLNLARRKVKTPHLMWLERVATAFSTCDLHYEGALMAPHGLEALADLVEECSWCVKVKRWGAPPPHDTPYIEAYDERIELTMDPGQGPRYTFFGAARRDQQEATVLLDELSIVFASGGVVHRMALFRTGDKDELLDYFHHGWPRDPVSE